MPPLNEMVRGNPANRLVSAQHHSLSLLMMRTKPDAWNSAQSSDNILPRIQTRQNQSIHRPIPNLMRQCLSAIGLCINQRYPQLRQSAFNPVNCLRKNSGIRLKDILIQHKESNAPVFKSPAASFASHIKPIALLLKDVPNLIDRLLRNTRTVSKHPGNGCRRDPGPFRNFDILHMDFIYIPHRNNFKTKLNNRRKRRAKKCTLPGTISRDIKSLGTQT